MSLKEIWTLLSFSHITFFPFFQLFLLSCANQGHEQTILKSQRLKVLKTYFMSMSVCGRLWGLGNRGGLYTGIKDPGWYRLPWAACVMITTGQRVRREDERNMECDAGHFRSQNYKLYMVIYITINYISLPSTFHLAELNHRTPPNWRWGM